MFFLLLSTFFGIQNASECFDPVHPFEVNNTECPVNHLYECGSYDFPTNTKQEVNNIDVNEEFDDKLSLGLKTLVITTISVCSCVCIFGLMGYTRDLS